MGNPIASAPRPARRFLLRAPALFESPEVGSGTIENVSSSGVLIAHASRRFEVGSAVVLRLSLFPGSFETTFRGRVVRHTESGFAATFTALGPRQLETLRNALPHAAFSGHGPSA